MTLLLAVIAVALVFEFLNGFHDTANSVASVVGTKVLTPSRAIALASVMNLCGALAGTAVATTVGTGLVDAHCVTGATIICGLLGGIFWNLLTWRMGLPSSSSHALIGGLVGAAIASSGNRWDVIIWSAPVAGKPWYLWDGLLYKVIIPMFSSPILGLFGGFVWMFQPGKQRCPEDDGNNRFSSLFSDSGRSPCASTPLPAVPANARIQGSALGQASLRHHHGRRHRHRRKAHHQDPWPEGVETAASERLCRRHNGRYCAYGSRQTWHARLDHPCGLNLDYGGRHIEKSQGDALASYREHRVGVVHDIARDGACRLWIDAIAAGLRRGRWLLSSRGQVVSSKVCEELGK